MAFIVRESPGSALRWINATADSRLQGVRENGVICCRHREFVSEQPVTPIDDESSGTHHASTRG